MAEGARLESVYTATYRGFESPPHRHIRDESLYESTGSFLLYSPQGGFESPPHRHIRDESLYESTGSFLLYSPQGGDENPRPGFDNWQRQLDRPRTQ